jgi:hypothetical protein
MGFAYYLKKKTAEAQADLKNKEAQEHREAVRIQKLLEAERSKKFKHSVKESTKKILEQMEIAAAAGRHSLEFEPRTYFNYAENFPLADIVQELKRHIGDPEFIYKTRSETVDGEWVDVGDYREGYTTRWIEISW